LSIFRSGLIGLRRGHSDRRQVDRFTKRQCTPIRDHIGRHRIDRTAEHTRADQETTLGGGEVNVEMGSREQSRGAFNQRAGYRYVDNSKFATPAEPDPRQRVDRAWRPTLTPATLHGVSQH
jgi:hypothetical protein